MTKPMVHTALYTALGVALVAGASTADAQTVITREIADQPVETVITQQPGETVVAEQPIAAPVAVAPTETVETVRTERSTTVPRRHFVSRHVTHRHFVRNRTTDRVTTTRTIVRERVVPPVVAAAPLVAPAVAAITEPGYTEVVQAPRAPMPEPGYPAYSAPLYDVVSGQTVPPPLFAQPTAAPLATAAPSYRYVYQSDRILVVDPTIGIAVQSIPR